MARLRIFAPVFNLATGRYVNLGSYRNIKLRTNPMHRVMTALGCLSLMRVQTGSKVPAPGEGPG